MLMKTFFLQSIIPLALYLFYALAGAPLYGQATVGGTTSSSSAELDIQSTTRGLLPPRMTTAQRSAIVTPAKGLLVFNTTLNCIEVNMGTPSAPAWGCLIPANTVSAPSVMSTRVCRSGTIAPITHTTTGAAGIGTAIGLPAGLTATWASNTITISGTVGSVTSIATYNYTIPLTGGVDGGQATGTIIVAGNNTVSTISSPLAMAVGRAMTVKTHRTTGATGIGTPSGLPAGVTASWVSDTIVLSGTPTAAAGTYNYTIPLTGGCGSVTASGQIIVEPADCGAFVADGVWKVFKCHNLGADATANPFTPDWRLNGSYYQWGKSAVAALAPTGSGSTQTNAAAVSGWSTNVAADGSWADGSKTGNDPCPAGFRVPTDAQWRAVIDESLNPTATFAGTWGTDNTNYNAGWRVGSGSSGLYLPAAGARRNTNGALDGRGSDCNYWSSTGQSSPNAFLLYVNRSFYGYPFMASNHRNTGASLRCISL
jgi:uncharacterized protein (TIGR02145 family)